jgi:uncharacterized lipoprotein YddW (UPF0748 family)
MKVKLKNIAISFCVILVLFLGLGIFTGILAENSSRINSSGIEKGVWVSVFSEKRVLYSKDMAKNLIEICKKAKISQIYLQLYQSGRAYYDSKICDRSKYKDMLKFAGSDIIDFLLQEAKNNDIRVFAWINLLSLGKNNQAEVLTKFGDDVLTRDQHLRTSLRSDAPGEFDKYYLREDQLFLEPADSRVRDYLVSIIDEILTRYPLFSGVHLDYVRYPYIVPFVPGARFNKFGLTYGYGRKSVELFKEETGINPFLGLSSDDKSLQWDDWRRQQITNLVREIANHIKTKAPDLLVSCAVLSLTTPAYASAFQDWPLWVEEGLVDYVVLMNYTRDRRLAYEITKSALAFRGKGRVYIGLGVFLTKDNPDDFLKQYEQTIGLRPDGIVLFSFDDITNPIANILSSH